MRRRFRLRSRQHSSLQNISRETYFVKHFEISARYERQGLTRWVYLVKKLLVLKIVWCWPQDNDILCDGLDDSFSPTLRRKHLDLGSQFDYITIVRQFHSGCKTAPKSFDRKYAGIIHQFKLSNAI